MLKLHYKSIYLMSVAFRSIPYSTDVVLNVVFSITGKHSDSCRKTKHSEDKLHSLPKT